MSSAEDSVLPLRTPLYPLHVELNAKIVPFAGYAMPLQFTGGIMQEHRHTRSKAGLFDVSHMGQVRLSGNLGELERLCPIDLSTLREGQQRYTVLTNDCGGVLDDLMVSRSGDQLLLVVNAACKREDLAHLQRQLAGSGCKVEELADRALLALQGPASAEILAELCSGIRDLVFMTGAWFSIAAAECYITRSGYTGEDGFEISVPAAAAETLARRLLEHPDAAPVGLGARDSLRLEAGMCLYGHELDAATTPVEADLVWTIPKGRREGLRRGGFPGSEIIIRQLGDGVARRRVGILPDGKVPVREGAELHSAAGARIGRITSGGFSPTLGRPIAMGYVTVDCAREGTQLTATVRDRPVPARVVRLPFVAPRYHRG